MRDVYKYDIDGQYNRIESIQDVTRELNLDVYKSIFAKDYEKETKGLWDMKPIKFFAKETDEKMAAVQRPLKIEEMDENEIFFIPQWMIEDMMGVEEADKTAEKKKELDKKREDLELILWADCRGANGRNGEASGMIVALYQDKDGDAIEYVWDYHTYYKQVIMNAYTKHKIKDSNKWYELIKKQRGKNRVN